MDPDNEDEKTQKLQIEFNNKLEEALAKNNINIIEM